MLLVCSCARFMSNPGPCRRKWLKGIPKQSWEQNNKRQGLVGGLRIYLDFWVEWRY